MSRLVSTMEELLSSFFSRHKELLKRIIPCSHCFNSPVNSLATGTAQKVLEKSMKIFSESTDSLFTQFTVEECIEALNRESDAFLMCKNEKVSLNLLAPDLIMNNFVMKENVVIGDWLGDGGFGEGIRKFLRNFYIVFFLVYKGHLEPSNEVVAIKRLKIALAEEEEPDQILMEKFLEFKHEITIMR